MIHKTNKFDDGNAVKRFLNHGYALLEAPYLSEQAGNALKNVDAFFREANDDFLETMQFRFPQNNSFWGPVHKKRDEGKDEKFIFDFGYHYPTLLELGGVKITPHEYIRDSMKDILEQTEDRLMQFLEVLEGPFLKKTGVSNLIDLFEISRSQHVLRKILYPGTINVKDSAYRADDHIDQACIAVHVFQDYSGLYLGEKSNIYEPKKNHILIFAGAKMQKLTGGRVWREKVLRHGKEDFILRGEGGHIPAVRHGVIAPYDATHLNERSVIVGFFHTPTTLPI